MKRRSVLLSRFRSFLSLKSTLANNTAWMLAGQGSKLLIQALYFIVIARSLGAQNYGAFVGVVGFVGVLMPFCTMGSGYLLIKNVSRNKDQFAENWGNALSTTFLSSLALFGVVVLISHFLLPADISLKLIMLVAASDLFGNGITQICCQAFMAFERMKWTASISALLSALRLVAAVILVATRRNPTALDWGELYFASTTIVTLLALVLVLMKLGTPVFGFTIRATEIREGLYFSFSASVQTIYNDIDKAMLARLSTLEATGIYAAAYRIMDVSLIPVSAVLTAAYPKFFRLGVDGIQATLRYAKPLMYRALAYASLVAVGLLISAPIVPHILGMEYRLTAEALCWLAVLPLIKAAHFFLGDALTGAGYQGLRTAIGSGVAAFNVSINMWIIPKYSWRGAAVSSIASDALLLALVATGVFVLYRRSQHLAPQTEAFEARARV